LAAGELRSTITRSVAETCRLPLILAAPRVALPEHLVLGAQRYGR